MIDALANVSALWLDPENPLRRDTIQALQVSTELSPHQVELAITNCFEELTYDKISTFIENWGQSPEMRLNEFPGTVPRSSIKCVFHVLPANAFTAWVHGAVITLLAGWRCVLKPSTREPVFSRAWQKSLALVDSKLSDAVDIVPWGHDQLKKSDVVVAYGSDETLQKIRALLKPDTRFAGYGHKISVGVVYSEALDNPEALFEQICADAQPFRLQGCLSPQILYVEGMETRWPELTARLDVVPKIKVFKNPEDLPRELAKFSPYLSCVGFAGSSERLSALEQGLMEHPDLRICPLGQMQKPPLGWTNGGVDLSNLLN